MQGTPPNTPNGDVTELLREDLYPTAAAIEDHLVSRWVETAYDPMNRSEQPRWNARQAERWLGYFAGRTSSSDADIAWWSLIDLAPGGRCAALRWLVRVGAGVGSGLLVGAVFGQLFNLTAYLILSMVGWEVDIGDAVAGGWQFGLVAGFGLAVFLLLSPKAPAPSQVRLMGGGGNGWRNALKGIRSAAPLGVLVAVFVALWLKPGIAVVLGLVVGVASGLPAALAQGTRAAVAPSTIAGPARSLAIDRRTTLVQFVVFGLGFGLVTAAGRRPWSVHSTVSWQKHPVRTTAGTAM